MRRHAIGLILICGLVGCGGLRDIPNEPERLTLFSIDGREAEADTIARAEYVRGKGVPKAVGEFYGYPVLGSVEITDPAERRKIMAALKDGIARGGSPAACFWPRHGLRAVENGKTFEYVICFACHMFGEYQDGKKVSRPKMYISHDVRPAFDAPLKAAGVPFAPDD